MKNIEKYTRLGFTIADCSSVMIGNKTFRMQTTSIGGDGDCEVYITRDSTASPEEDFTNNRGKCLFKQQIILLDKAFIFYSDCYFEEEIVKNEVIAELEKGRWFLYIKRTEEDMYDYDDDYSSDPPKVILQKIEN